MIGAIILVLVYYLFIFLELMQSLLSKTNKPFRHNDEMGINNQTVEILFSMLIGVLIVKKQNLIGII